MKPRLYQYGQCSDLPGISIGVARQVPRGVRVEDRFRKGYFQVWMPLLAPSPDLYKAYLGEEMTYKDFARRYRSEMKAPEPQRAISLLAAVSQNVRINLGCFCKEDSRCHRSQLATLIQVASERLPPPADTLAKFFSPPCSMPEIED